MSDRKRLSSLSIALIVSLVANALLIGFLVGGQLGERDHRRHGPRGADHMIARGIQSIVPDDEREGIRDAFRDAFRSASGSWREKRQARDDLVAALSSSPFDPAAVDNAFLAMRTADARLNETFQTALSDQIAALSPEQRAELVAWLEEVEARRAEARAERPERRGGREDRDGPPPR
ncbi:periplasmic heavy metal sensor [Henriciella marina]|uniref:periplasmic heavy metal sensor n=1 Tax=Henriciella marina TaxID=453851 RepID=UPI000368E132|nr:periplasmic heavy metal sensor [Henriciella marina]